MEARDLEIERFARKAGGYKKALELAPRARSLELSAVVAIVLGVCRDRNWSPECTSVVDFMAGSGALSRALKDAGFKKIKALEACPEMLPESAADLEFLNGKAFTNLRSSLIELKPQVIVSLAGFHHLIERCGKGVDYLRSVVTQATVAGACVDALLPGGVLIVVDIADDIDFEKLRIDLIKEWDGAAFRNIDVGGEDFRNQLFATKGLDDFKTTVHTHLGAFSDTCTLKWFREVVDKETVIGHDDVAISAPLLQVLRWKYGDRVRIGRLHCPWIFGSVDHATEFVLQKFGFYVDRRAGEIHRDRVVDNMRTYLEMKDCSAGGTMLAWSLGVWMVRAPDIELPATLAPTMTMLLFVHGLIMLMRSLLSWVVGAGTPMDSVLSSMMWVVIGLIIGQVYDEMKRKLR